LLIDISVVFLAISFAQVPKPSLPPASPLTSPSPSAHGPLDSQTQASPRPVAGSDVASIVAEADACFSKRSDGAVNGVADKREIDDAIAAYRRAVAASPQDLDTLAKLLRALHFRGAYTGLDDEGKKAVFEEGRDLGQRAVDALEAQAKNAKGLSRVEFLRLRKGTPALYLWTAGHWGEWGLVRGKFAAARSGVASKLRDLSQTVIDLDPSFEGAAGYRLLGRLHAEAPKIIFITGWVSKEKALQFLRRAYQTAPDHPVTLFFLAEAILDHDPAKKDEALALLEKCASATPRSDTVLEDSRYAQLAKKRLDQARPAK
jgi:tetratricopeptide (TPR) repeat protein